MTLRRGARSIMEAHGISCSSYRSVKFKCNCKLSLQNLSVAALQERARQFAGMGLGVSPTNLADEFIALCDAARREQVERFRRALCPECHPKHMLDNGRVWAGCGMWMIISPAFPEQEAAAAIRAQQGGEK